MKSFILLSILLSNFCLSVLGEKTKDKKAKASPVSQSKFFVPLDTNTKAQSLSNLHSTEGQAAAAVKASSLTDLFVDHNDVKSWKIEESPEAKTSARAAGGPAYSNPAYDALPVKRDSFVAKSSSMNDIFGTTAEVESWNIPMRKSVRKSKRSSTSSNDGSDDADKVRLSSWGLPGPPPKKSASMPDLGAHNNGKFGMKEKAGAPPIPKRSFEK